MKFDSNQPACLFGTAKTHHFENLKDNTVAKLKFKPIINQTGTFTCDVTKVTSDYLRPLRKNQCSIDYRQKFPSMLCSISSLEDDIEYV